MSAPHPEASENNVRSSEERLRLAVEGTGIGTWDYSPKTGSLRWDARCKELFGLPPEAYVDFDVFLAGLHPDDRAMTEAVVSGALDPKGSGQYDVEYRTIGLQDGGKVRWIRATGRTFFDDQRQADRFIGTVFDITEQKAAEMRLRETEARYRLIGEAANDTIWDWDLVRDHVTWNDGICRVFGYAPGTVEPTGQWWLDHLHPDDRDRVAHEIHGCIDGVGDRWTSEYRFQRADGEYLMVFDRGRVVRDAAGKPLRMAGSMLDLSERHRSQEEIARLAAVSDQQRRLYETILSGTPDLVYVWGLNHRFTYANRALLRMWGKTWDEAIGRHCSELGYPDWHAAMHDREIDHVVATQESVRGEVPYAGPLGRRIYDYILVPVLDAQGDVTAVAGTTRDVTEQHQARETLRRSEETARFVAQVSAQLAEVTDPQSTMQKVAALAVPIFADWCCLMELHPEDGVLRRSALAHANAEAVVKARTTFEAYPPRGSDAYGAAKVLRTGETEFIAELTDEVLQAIAHDEEHLTHLRALGLVSWIHVPLRRRGRVLGVASFVTAESKRRYDALDVRVAEDMGERAAVALENATLYLELREADRRKDEFLATLAHELRNPLAPIRNALHLMDEHAGSATDFGEARGMMERQVSQLVRLVDDLLDVSRITRGKVELRCERLSVAQVVRSAVEISQSLMRERQHKLSVELPSEPIFLNADPVRLAQVISNLLNNSARYTKPGGQIVLRAWRDGGEAVISVRDNGIGIDAEMLSSIFEMFTQAKRTFDQVNTGLGIGLTLARRLVELHGGSVEARSAGAGQGSEFLVRLPVGPQEPSAADGTLRPPVVNSVSGRRILVVDDNRDAALTLTKLLARGGHEVRTVFDGLEAVREAGEFQPGVILLDIGLPGLNGYEVAARIRRDSTHGSPTLIALTGWGQQEDRRKAREAGFDHHLVKPVDFAELKTLLTHLPASPTSASSA